MAKYEQPLNTCNLFTNDDKREGKKDADLRGEANIEGRPYYVSAWRNTSKNGQEYLKLSFKPKGERAASERVPEKVAAPTPASDPEFNDEIPF